MPRHGAPAGGPRNGFAARGSRCLSILPRTSLVPRAGVCYDYDADVTGTIAKNLTRLKEGDQVNVISGIWKDTVGKVQTINAKKQTVTINVELFGRETPVEISFSDIRKL